MGIAIASGLVFVAVALLPQAAAAQFAEKKVLTLEIARKIVGAAESEAERNHLAGVVAVVDDGGWPILIDPVPDRVTFLLGSLPTEAMPPSSLSPMVDVW